MKIGIIGFGLIGKKRASSVGQNEIKIIADLNIDDREQIFNTYGARVTNDWMDVIKSDVDLVIVATPHNLLAPITLECVKNKKHVLVEKPAAINSLELEAIISLAEQNNCLVKVGFNHRFHPSLQKAYEIFKRGEIGELMFMRARYGHGGRIGYDKEWRCKKEISGGGEIIDQGSHLIDLSRWFLGDLTLDYSNLSTYFWDIKVEDNCFLALKSKSDQMAWLHATWTEWKNCFSFEIYGRTGKLQIEGLGGSYGIEKLIFYKMDMEKMGPPNATSFEFDGPDLSWKMEFEEFEDAIKNNRQPAGNIYDAFEMMKIIDQAYKSNK